MVSFAALKESVSLTDGVKRLGLTLTEKDGVFRGKCPACNAGGERALVVTPNRGFFCFHKKQGGDVIALAAHIKGVTVKEAAEWLATATPTTTTAPGGLKPLDYLDPTHEKSLAIVGEETARIFELGYAPKGIMRGTVAVPLHDPNGTLVAYVGIEEDGTYRFPSGFMASVHIFNLHRVVRNDVYLLPSVGDVLRAYENGVDQAICFLTNDIDPIQLKALAEVLEERHAVLIL
jgi:hypothetical protein